MNKKYYRSIYNKDFLYILVMLFLSVCFGLYSVHLGIDSENDSYNYHFYNGFAFINGRTFTDLAPAGLHSYFNPFLDALVFLGITNIPQKIYAFLLGFFQGLNLFPIYYISKVLFFRFNINKILILLVSLIGLFHSLFLTQLGVAMHDSLTSLFILISLCFLLSYYNVNSILGFYVPSLIIGVVVGLKLTTAIYGVAFGVIIALYSLFIRNYRIVVCSGLLMVIGFLLSNGWWMLQLWDNFQNPFYPYFNQLFKSPFATIDPSVYVDEYFFRQKGLQKLFYPIFFSNDPGLASGYFGWPLHSFYREAASYLLSILVIIAMFSFKWRMKRRSYLDSKYYLFFLFCAISYIIWYLKFGVLRYLMPVLLLAPTIIILSIFLLLFERVRISEGSLLLKFRYFRKVILNLSYNFIFVVLFLLCSFFTYKDLENGFPMDAHKPITDSKFILDNPLNKHDNNANVYFITGTPRVWQAWVFPALNLQGLAVPLKSGIFKYENEALIQKRTRVVDNILKNDGYAVVIRDLTGNGWISEATSDEETNAELKVYNLKMSSNCREYNSGFGSNIHRLKFCNVEKL